MRTIVYHIATVLAVLQCCDICVTIRVPIAWDGESEVLQTNTEEPKTSADKIQAQNLQQPVPIEYFQYTANKPQFAVDIAKFHGVQSPEDHFKSRPVRPYTGKEKPQLGRHKIQDIDRPVFEKFQEYVNKDDETKYQAAPGSSSYEIFHPYKAEEPGLQGLYKDPVLDKIRNDIRGSSQRLQTYENEAGKPNIESGEYLESIQETDRKKTPQQNVPMPYEIHRPQRRPIYYRPLPRYSNRDHILNQRFKHPWNQNYAKIRPVHYVPLQNHLQRLRQNHALKYDDERNEYPQISPPQHYEEPSDGYDIYEKGKEKYINLRNNLDESINNVVKESRPSAPQKLELQADEEEDPDEEDEFIPIKNYAQVRKTETTRHLPKHAAFDDAETYEEIRNAPRLREAVKSTKAQTVYTEEGYEDSAYDHAGEQKHASDHEGHAGYLREKELSAGKYKAPSVSAKYEDGTGSAYRDQIIHGKKWNDNNKDSQKEEEVEDYAENEQEELVEAESHRNGPLNKSDSQRNKRQDDKTDDSETYDEIVDDKTIEEALSNETGEDVTDDNKTIANDNNTHGVNKRETNDFKVPDIKLDTTFLNEKEILNIAKQKIIDKDDLKEKYPYYFKNLKSISEHSPLRYAENLKFIPRKSKGGTEFYDSRSLLECPEVDDKVDAIPEKLKKGEDPDKNTSDNTDQNKGESGEVAPRLTGLGDKIDCFKAKYFGENPLDSPFFKEEIISNPEPIKVPTLSIFKSKKTSNPLLLSTATDNIIFSAENLKRRSDSDIFTLFDKLQNDENKIIKPVLNETKKSDLVQSQNSTPLNETSVSQHHNVYSDILLNIGSNLHNPYVNKYNTSSILENLQEPIRKIENQNVNYKVFENEKDVTEPVGKTRKRRAVPFVYEPYKIIREVQTPDSKKTTTSSNISPLIKQLQTSKVIDTVKTSNGKDQPVKRTVTSRTYKDIGRKDREQISNFEDHDNSDASFVNVNVDKRRGEPRYELRISNHKSQYSPVDNKKAMSIEDYEAQTKNKNNSDKGHLTNTQHGDEKTGNKVASSDVYDIVRYLPKSEDTQKSAASNTVKTTIASSPLPPTHKEATSEDIDDESEEDYDEDYEDDEEDTINVSTTTTTTSTTIKPAFRRKIRVTTTTAKYEEVTEEPRRLRLVTRFRNPTPVERHTTERPQKSTQIYEHDEEPANYREKKKKSTKSTIVTDSKKYGDDDDDDMRKEEIDALIGVKQDMDDYTPLYEKEVNKQSRTPENDSNEDENSSEEIEDAESEEDDDEDYENDEEEEEEITTNKTINTTTEAPKRTLIRTTETPSSTTETKKAVEPKPLITRKKIEIHKESPVNKSSPHMSQFKQDIKEVEVIKEMPRKKLERKNNKHVELLDLYKDENLAKDINKLSAVEIFKENLDLEGGPKHGGNYRRAPAVEELEITSAKPVRRKSTKAPKDAVASQTEHKKHLELDDDIPVTKLHGGNLKSISDGKRTRGKPRNEKLIELTTEFDRESMHGGNFKSAPGRARSRDEAKSAKLIELDDSNEYDDDADTKSMHGGNFKAYGSRNRDAGLHGGNYRSAKLVSNDNEKGETKSLTEAAKLDAPKNARTNAAILLNSFARAAPILTSTPAYIIDPSKRMYYYVDA